MTYPLNLALFQPDIAANVGAMMRLCAGLGVELSVIDPCGFVWDEAKMKRAGMDYRQHVALTRHASWAQFLQSPMVNNGRILLLSTKADTIYTDFTYQKGDVLLMGSESAGVPDDVHNTVPHRLKIPMQPGLRSLNVATASAMVLGEALRQIRIAK